MCVKTHDNHRQPAKMQGNTIPAWCVGVFMGRGIKNIPRAYPCHSLNIWDSAIPRCPSFPMFGGACSNIEGCHNLHSTCENDDIKSDLGIGLFFDKLFNCAASNFITMRWPLQCMEHLSSLFTWICTNRLFEQPSQWPFCVWVTFS